jgi:hypothetical protein
MNVIEPKDEPDKPAEIQSLEDQFDAAERDALRLVARLTEECGAKRGAPIDGA